MIMLNIDIIGINLQFFGGSSSVPTGMEGQLELANWPFLGVPTGMEGNEIADLTAENALKLKDEEIMKVPFGKG